MTASANGMTIISLLASRDLTVLRRQPARVIATIGTPLLLWIFLSSGFARSAPGTSTGDGFDVVLIPGMMTLVAVFSSVFASLSLIEDRENGWLKTVLVAPVGRSWIVLGKVMGGSIVSFLQAALLLLLLPFTDATVTLGGVGLMLAALLITCVGMTALGLFFAWRCPSAGSYHAVMNIVLMPMWLLSGAFFPDGSSSVWLTWIMHLNPLAWCTRALRGGVGEAPFDDASVLGWLATAAAWMVVMLVAATRRAHSASSLA